MRSGAVLLTSKELEIYLLQARLAEVRRLRPKHFQQWHDPIARRICEAREEELKVSLARVRKYLFRAFKSSDSKVTK